MIILVYLLSIVANYIAYMLASVILGISGLAIKRKIYKILNKNEVVTQSGQLLVFVSSTSTMISLVSSFMIFIYFDKTPNWFIIIPLFILSWFNFTPALYRPYFQSGAAHWGLVYGIIAFFLFFYKIL
jgi:hypothetical protein